MSKSTYTHACITIQLLSSSYTPAMCIERSYTYNVGEPYILIINTFSNYRYLAICVVILICFVYLAAIRIFVSRFLYFG